jgi:hypothetical protein
VSNFSSLIVLSFIGVCCLSYFFAPPIYSFRVDYSQDLITISAFVITSLALNFLVTKVRAEQREPALVWSLAPDGEPTYVSQRILDYIGAQLEDYRHSDVEALVDREIPSHLSLEAALSNVVVSEAKSIASRIAS